MPDWLRRRKEKSAEETEDTPEAQSAGERAEAAGPRTAPEAAKPVFMRTDQIAQMTQAEREQLAALLAPALDEELARIATLRRWSA